VNSLEQIQLNSAGEKATCYRVKNVTNTRAYHEVH